MPKKTTKKATLTEAKKERKKASPIETSKEKLSPAKKVENTPDLRSVYSNSKYTLMPLGLATDFNTNKNVVIFSDLTTGKVHTISLSVWNRWKLKEAKKINTET